MDKPNLFSYATSELSQDAFICWLLSWAQPEHQSTDDDLHACANRLIVAFFKKHGEDAPSPIKTVKVTKQDSHIDVLCIINFEHFIIIEDKTGTKHHSDQLARYREAIKIRHPDAKQIIPIYYKTEDQGSYSEIIKNGYQPFLRDDILRILDAYKGANPILLDYRNHLQSISDKVASFQFKELSNWKPNPESDSYAWVGFYIELKKRLRTGNWDYVANPNGGFLGFWWNSRKNDGCEQYLQLEENKLCFKIRVKKEADRTVLRAKWFEAIQARAKDVGLKVAKPARFGNGECMTVCVLDEEYRKESGGKIDMESTLAQLRKAEELLKLATSHG